MSKRPRIEDEQSSEDFSEPLEIPETPMPMEEGGQAAQGMSTGKIGTGPVNVPGTTGTVAKNMPDSPIMQQLYNDGHWLTTYTKIYHKCFEFVVYNSNWGVKNLTNHYNIVTPFYNLPYEKLMMYIAPNEWRSDFTHHRMATIRKCGFNMKYMKHLAYFETGGTDAQIAAPGNIGYCGVFKHLEKAFPVQRYYTPGNNPAEMVPAGLDDVIDFRKRLYAAPWQKATDTADFIGASDGPRQFYYRTGWQEHDLAHESDAKDPSRWWSSANMYQKLHKEFTTSDVGFNVSHEYYPYNGLLYAGPSITNCNISNDTTDLRGNIEWNDRNVYSYAADTETDNEPFTMPKTESDENTLVRIQKLKNNWMLQRGRFYESDFSYNTGTIENYNIRPVHKERNIKVPPSFSFGVWPTLQLDGKYVKGQTHFRVETFCVVDFQDMHAVSFNWDDDSAGTAFGEFVKCEEFQTVEGQFLVDRTSNGTNAEFRWWNGHYWHGGRPIFHKLAVIPTNVNAKTV